MIGNLVFVSHVISLKETPKLLIKTVLFVQLIKKIDIFGSRKHSKIYLSIVINAQVIKPMFSKVPFSFHKVTNKKTHMTVLYTNMSLYITFIVIYYVRQE